MAINKETHEVTSVILAKETKEAIVAIAKQNKRSLSSQIALFLEEKLDEMEVNSDEMEH